MFSIFTRTQVIAADDSSDIPAVDVGSAYSANTFRHLTQLYGERADDSVVGNVYAVTRTSDAEVCLVVVSRTQFVADTCTPSGDIPPGGLTLSALIRSTIYRVTWQETGTISLGETPL